MCLDRTGFGLTPTALWCEALRVAFLPTVPEGIQLADPQWWEETRDTFIAGKVSETYTYAAASQLILDGLLYIMGYYEPDLGWLRKTLIYTDDKIEELKDASTASRALFAELADWTRNRDDAPLRIAHCIRDLAYGDESRNNDLTAMIESDDPTYREIFERCYWRPTEEERQREEERQQIEADKSSPRRRERSRKQSG
jgi:hypothetical protein